MSFDSRKKLNVIVGLGKTGMSCLRYCLREGWPVAITDSCKNPPGEMELKKIAPNVETAFGGFSEKLINRASQLIISPGVSLQEREIEEAIQRGVSFVGDVELFVQRISSPIVAITGSNAKSTVTTLVGEMARFAGVDVQVAGNIGIPVLDLLKERQAALYVLELSSFQLETTHSLKAKVATILNISEDHMDRYSNMEEYIAAKQRIYQNCEVAVINRADKNVVPQTYMPKAMITFGLDKPTENQYGLIQHNNETFLACGEERLMNINEIKIRGQHNVENSLSSLALGDAVGLDIQGMLRALREFPGLPHRCQFVADRDGVSWYNDSKGTNVGATAAALYGLGSEEPGKIVLIAGGLGKGADFSLLREPVKKMVRKIILIGTVAEQLANIFKDVCEVEMTDSMENAVQLADLAAVRGDKVLLSPACASFDMFDNYGHRGEVFMRCVKDLEIL